MNSKFITLIKILVFALSSMTINGCSYLNSILKAEPAPDSGFIQDPEKMKPDRKRFPFDRVWCQGYGCDWTKYSSVVVKPIDLSHVLKMSWWDNFTIESKSELQEERHIIANYLREKIISEIKNDPNEYHEVVEIAKQDSMIIEFALVELVPTKVFMRTVADIIGFLIPGAQVLSLTGSGSVAIEGRIKDAETGVVIFKFADREQDISSIVNIKDSTWHGHANEAIDIWVKEFVELYDTPPTHLVEASNHFTLRVW